ncbi:MAG: dTDP-4-dehydrorhamnose reductase [Spiribacter salinus]|uniref:dTDP-4-dehydrorhamnose reductase n=1 Tax=Spiribacter salinus TaxID=1335746 RepID=A0A540VQW8_9GAMM|nr:MAG: dTDP-4-dehydrorhamnose reductase [Spiribacter salinus]
MTNSRILLFGGNGQVGWELRRALAPLGEVIAPPRLGAGGWCGDIEDLDALADTVRRVRPSVIVNAAAWTDVDGAEREPDAAWRLNADAPAVLARCAAETGAWLVHYSTDYVFDGRGHRPWSEADVPAPLNVYGASKLAGEEAIRAAGGHHLILRTSWVYAARRHNFVRTILRLARERESLRVIDDQIGAPTGAELIADVTVHILGSPRLEPRLGGTYHLAAAGATSWYRYARLIVEIADACGWPLRLAPECIEPVSTEAYGQLAPRPYNSRLDCTALERAFGLRMPDWAEGVERVVCELGDVGIE